MRTPPANRPLTPQNLLLDFGGKAALARDGVRTLFDALDADQSAALTRWMVMFGRWAGRAIDKIPQHLAKLAGQYGVGEGDCHIFVDHGFAAVPAKIGTVPFAARLLFAMQTYYALLVNGLAEQFGHGRVDGSLPGNPFAWCDSVQSKPMDRLLEQVTDVCSRFQITTTLSADDGECDLFKPLYQSLFPRALRRQLGEYYTPDWLAGHVLDQVGYSGQTGCRLLDPACGSGTFLMMALRRWLKGERGEGRARQAVLFPLLSPLSPPFPIVGFDLNPLAVMTARANFQITLAAVLPDHEPVEAPIYLHDSILGRGEVGGDCPSCRLSEDGTVPFGGELFDFVVGNPPWITWDNLPDDDRQATKPLWERYGLFSLSGNEARHGGGKKDLSMLMLYATADRYLKPRGRLGMVITQTLFQTKGAGDGFRRFRLGQDGPPLKVFRVDDMVALRPFGDASNWTSTIVLEKGAATEYPVPYFKWGEGREERGERNNERKQSIHHSSFIIHRCLASPVDPTKATSPWLISDGENSRGPTARGAVSCVAKPQAALPADYVAHLGANSGGANGVYWVEVLGSADDGVLIRNLAGRGKNHVETVECVIEPDLLYPLLRWGDVGRYSAAPAGYLLLAQDPATRAGIDESVMRTKYPRTLAYLEQFRELLVTRAAYRRYQQRGPFYSMYNVGPYTVAPIKVVWRRMDRRINAAVIEPCDAGLPPASQWSWGDSCTVAPGVAVQLPPQQGLAGETPAPQYRPAIPQETCVLVACDSSDEAHYLCAMLNSAAINERVAAHSVRGGKGFGTPGMFDFLPLRRYRPNDPMHTELADLSRLAHVVNVDEVSQATGTLVEGIQRRIDELA